ncbi:MAG: L-seryl-tRNA(Sec) selenium transferase [bacterium]|nr:L-seryl-tRNA(Sec) selenium transferase [bacterium]
MSKSTSNQYPVAVGKLIEHPSIQKLSVKYDILLKLCREEIERQRREGVPNHSLEVAVKNVTHQVEILLQPSFPKVLNGTGILLHTGLGRAVLPKEALISLENASQNCLLEIDPVRGVRGDRWKSIEKKLTYLLDVEAALVTNNCASAVLLVLSTLANKKEVIISRSELVEIGGSFRMPDVISAAGVKRIEVGTTNRVRLDDYEKAIHSKTAAILKVHPSNYRIVGFTESPTLQELKQLALHYNIFLIEDLGNGLLLNLEDYFLPYETTVQESVKVGVDVITFSGDKCFGGPQAGIIVGKSELIHKCKKHPVLRAVRPCKLTLSALDATLNLWLQNQTNSIPFVKQISASIDDLRKRATFITASLKYRTIPITIEQCDGFIGSGAVPQQAISDIAIVIHPKKKHVSRIAQMLRLQSPALFSEIHNEKIFIHLRTVDPSDDPVLQSILDNTLKSISQ